MSIVKQNNLSLVMEKGKVFCDSREMALKFKKRHEYVITKIEAELKRFDTQKIGGQKVSEYFVKSNYITKNNRELTRYLLTFKGFQAIALQFTGDEAFTNRIMFIEFFEKLLHSVEKDKLTAKLNKQDDLWLQFRTEGKVFRNKLTKAIQENIVKYREEAEKKMNDGKYFYHYTQLIYNTLGIDLPKGTNPRDVLDKRMLVRLEDMEDRVADMIVQYANEGVYYKDAFKKIKASLQSDKL